MAQIEQNYLLNKDEIDKSNLIKEAEKDKNELTDEIQRQKNQYDNYVYSLAEQTRKEQEILNQQLFDLNEAEKEMNENIINQQNEVNQQILVNEKYQLIERKRMEINKL